MNGVREDGATPDPTDPSEDDGPLDPLALGGGGPALPRAYAPPTQGFGSVFGKRRILITGCSGGLGRLLLERLILESADATTIVGIDPRPLGGPLAERIEHHEVTLSQNRAEDLFRRAPFDAVVHLAFVDDPRVPTPKRYETNVIGTMRLLEWCSRYGVGSVVVVSTAMVYGALQTNPTLLTEEFPTRADQYHGGLRDRVEADRLAAQWLFAHKEIRTVLLRPVHVVGPTVRTTFQRYLKNRLAPVLLGFDPMIQVVHESDAARAIELALGGNASGIFNIPGPSALPLREVLRYVGTEPVPIPHIGAPTLMRLLARTGLLPLEADYLDYIRFPMVVSGARAKRELGYEPRVGLKEALVSVRERA